jgi:hypothetical protein
MRCLEIVPFKEPDFYWPLFSSKIDTIPEAAVHAQMDPIQRPRDTTQLTKIVDVGIVQGRQRTVTPCLFQRVICARGRAIDASAGPLRGIERRGEAVCIFPYVESSLVNDVRGLLSVLLEIIQLRNES